MKIHTKLFLGFSLSIAVLSSGFTFFTVQSATDSACQAVRVAGKLPSNDWIGILDTPADRTQIDNYCFQKKYVTPSIFSILVLSCTLGVEGLAFILLRFILKVI